jgi:hypothetical protein
MGQLWPGNFIPKDLAKFSLSILIHFSLIQVRHAVKLSSPDNLGTGFLTKTLGLRRSKK